MTAVSVAQSLAAIACPRRNRLAAQRKPESAAWPGRAERSTSWLVVCRALRFAACGRRAWAAVREGLLPAALQGWAQLAGRVSESLPIGAATSATPGCQMHPCPTSRSALQFQWLLSAPAPVGPARAESSSSPRSSARRSARPLTSSTLVSTPRGRPLAQRALATLPPPRPLPGPSGPPGWQHVCTAPGLVLACTGRRTWAWGEGGGGRGWEACRARDLPAPACTSRAVAPQRPRRPRGWLPGQGSDPHSDL